jgi:hypothetical protein
MSTSRLAQKLKQIRETLSHSREVMARHLDVEVNDVDRYESGEVPPLTIILHYARLGLVTVESLIDDQLDIRVGSTAKERGRYLKHAWAKRDADGDYWLFIEGGDLKAMFLLSSFEDDDNSIERRALAAWLAEQDSTNGKSKK